MKKKAALILAVLLAISASCLSACGNKDGENYGENIIDTSLTAEDEKAYAVAVTDFALKLTGRMYSNKNLLLSPLSAYTALSVCSNGARGQTAAQLKKALGLDTDALNAASAKYIKKTMADESPVKSANSVWYKSGEIKISDGFAKICSDYYGAQLKKEAFDEKTRGAMNSWIYENTDGKIKNAVESINKSDVLYIINTLCFESSWSDVYNGTVDGVFTDASGNRQKIDYLASEEHNYIVTEKGYGFEKSYLNGKYAFVAMLPADGVTLSEFVMTLDADEFIKAVTLPKEERVVARLPKFTVSDDLILNDAAVNMGISDLFDSEKCDLSAMGAPKHGNICVARIIHKTYINVCEKGTDAAAATIITTRNGTSVSDREPITVTLDRPFFYAIIDSQNGIPLFTGILNHVE